MIENLEEILTKTILSFIPKNVKPLSYLMSVLGIGRESVYRRLKGVIPFTFKEVVKLSGDLQFSIDEMIENGVKNNNYLSGHQEGGQQAPEQYFYTSHLNFYNFLQAINDAKEVDVYLSLNRLCSFFTVGFDTLFKFNYYIWLNQFGEIPFNTAFSDVRLPLQIVSLQHKIKAKTSSVKDITFIFDRNILTKLVQELQYYYSRKLITEDELQEIKKDLAGFLDSFEKLIQSGTEKESYSTCHFYLSMLNIDMNSVYGTIDEDVISHFWTYADIAHNTGHNDLIASHRNWIHSLKRGSIMISQSNEITQASFLNLQRKNIDKITNDLFFYYG